MMKFGIIAMCFCVFELFAHKNNSEVFLVPYKGVTNITVGESSLKDVQRLLGVKKVEKKWRKSIGYELFGKYAYFLEYENIGIFSTLAGYRNRNIVAMVTLDSTSTCKTTNGFGIGSSYFETIQELGRTDQVSYKRMNNGTKIYLIYKRMYITFDGKDSLSSSVNKIEILAPSFTRSSQPKKGIIRN